MALGPSGQELAATAQPRGSAPIRLFPLPGELLRSWGPGDGGAAGSAPTKGSPPAASPAGDGPGDGQSPCPPSPAALPGRALRPSHRPVPADDFPLAQLRRRHVPHEVDEELPALLRDVGVCLLCRAKALSPGSAPLPEPSLPVAAGRGHPPPGPVPSPGGRHGHGGGPDPAAAPGRCPEHGGRAGCCWLPPLWPAPERAPWHRPAVGGWTESTWPGDSGGHPAVQSRPRPGHRQPHGAAQPSPSPGTHP